MISANEWSSFPGPDKFFREIVEDLYQGKSVIIVVPEHLPGDLLKVTKGLVKERGNLKWCDDFVVNDNEPIRQLHKHFIPSHKVGELKDVNVNGLIRSESFGSRVIPLRLTKREQWHKWIYFLNDFTNANRSTDVLHQTQFISAIPKNWIPPFPKHEVLLSEHHWNGILGQIDTKLFNYLLFYDHRSSWLEKQLAIAISCELALWDFSLCEKLAGIPFKHLLKPQEELCEHAQKLGWKTEIEEDKDVLWNSGICQSYEGKEEIHSAYLALNKRLVDVEKRIWKAEISILFPYIELQRQKIISSMSSFLEIPHYRKDGTVIKDIVNLEIGDIAYQFGNNNARDINYQTRFFIRSLWEARNDLAHLIPVRENYLIELVERDKSESPPVG